jgi:hypothetical protein
MKVASFEKAGIGTAFLLLPTLLDTWRKATSYAAASGLQSHVCFVLWRFSQTNHLYAVSLYVAISSPRMIQVVIVLMQVHIVQDPMS